MTEEKRQKLIKLLKQKHKNKQVLEEIKKLGIKRQTIIYWERKLFRPEDHKRFIKEQVARNKKKLSTV
jgi:Zn-dependent peptidase ImmA (M78 family)